MLSDLNELDQTQEDLIALQERIRASPYTAFNNRSHARSFSINILRENANELISATRQIRDPDQGLYLMSENNREAGKQAHREINRFVHNFAAGAMSLVDHTRVLIGANYKNTELWNAYNKRVKADFAGEPVAKFVQDLRNYMVHRGLPNSHMFIHFDNTDANEIGPQLTTGVRFETAPLKTWDGWTAPARIYIENAGEHIDIHVFVEAYVEKVVMFHNWLDDVLLEYHHDDLVQLQQMQEEYARRSADAILRRDEQDSLVERPTQDASTPPIALSSVEDQIEQMGRAILRRIRKIFLSKQENNDFKSERPISTKITAENMRGTPVIRRADADGKPIVAFISSNGDLFGLDAEIYQEVDPLIDKVLSLEWATEVLSRNFIENNTVDWLRSSFEVTEPESLVAAIFSAQAEKIEPLECWIPIAHLESEDEFDFGPVKIAPITAAMIDRLEARGVEFAPNQSDDVKAMFNNLRARMQGYAAVVMYTNVESERAREEAIAIAENAVGILRFFAPIAQRPLQVISIAPLGLDITPRTQALVFGNGSFSFSDHLVSPPYLWRVSKNDASRLREEGLETASRLIRADNLNDFEQAVRASMLLYSTGLTLFNHKDRVFYTLSSMERLLIRHSSEAIEFNVEERMGFLLAPDRITAGEISRNVRETYRLRRRHGAFVLTNYDQQSLADLSRNARSVIATALTNLSLFDTIASFVDAIEFRRSNIT